MQIKVHNPNNLPLIDYREVNTLQGSLKDLKEDNYIKLKNVLIKRGFDIPLFIWVDQIGLKWLLDGHQRIRVMLKEDSQPYLVPYLEIEAKDKTEAMAKLLEITSQYGTITQEGLDSYLAEIDLPEAEIYEAVVFDALPWLRNQNRVESVNQQDEWQGMPEFQALSSALKLVISFESADKRDEFVDSISLQVQSKLASGTWITWWPYRYREDRSSIKYELDESTND